MTFQPECRIEWFRPCKEEWVLCVYIGGTELYLASIKVSYSCNGRYLWDTDDENNGYVDDLSAAIGLIREALKWQYEIPPIEE